MDGGRGGGSLREVVGAGQRPAGWAARWLPALPPRSPSSPAPRPRVPPPFPALRPPVGRGEGEEGNAGNGRDGGKIWAMNEEQMDKCILKKREREKRSVKGNKQ